MTARTQAPRVTPIGRPSVEELRRLLAEAEAREDGDQFVGGVAYTLRWVLGEAAEPEL